VYATRTLSVSAKMLVKTGKALVKGISLRTGHVGPLSESVVRIVQIRFTIGVRESTCISMLQMRKKSVKTLVMTGSERAIVISDWKADA
jgi:hypothetical protein